MEKKVIKRILAILMIITILTTDFFVLGSSLITYATNQIETATDEPNIEFSTYFKDKTGQKLSNAEQSIKNENLKLYAEIKVNNEGYFTNGTIEILDDNFSVESEILSTEIASIKGNEISLKQINAGETVEIELAIEPIMSDKMPVDMLLTAIVKLTGTYISSENEEGKEITPVSRQVGVIYQVDENAQAELDTNIITNKVFSIGEKNQRIVQLLIKSKLLDNQYPVEQTTLSVSIPELGETEPEVSVLSANGRTNISNYTTKNGVVEITLSNKADENDQIAWYKNGCDEVVVTFIYDEGVDASNVNITTNSEMKVYNSENTYKAQHIKEIENKEPNNVIMANPEITTTELYKGQLYANTVVKEETEKQKISYDTTTTLVVTNVNLASEIVINESSDKFVLTDDTILDTDAKYVSIEINKQQLLNLLGTNGSITIKNGDALLGEIKNISQIESENIVINYTDSAKELQIVASKPVTEGILEIKHTKTMTENNYSRAQIKTIKEIKTTSSIQGTSSVENPAEARVEINETVSKAELTVLSKANLSTTEVNNVTLGITLVTEGVEYDLYKNPVIAIQMPSAVEKVVFNTIPTIQNVINNDEIVIEDYNYEETTNQIKIKVNGEQTKYPGGTLSELYIPLDLSITLSKLVATQTSAIKMIYTNENASEYYGGTTDVGVFEQKVKIQAPTGLIKYFNLKSNTNTSISEEISQQLFNKNAGEELEFELALVNNTESDMSNVKILGKLPTTGNSENTFETTLKSLTAQNATIYFTENSNATDDTTDVTNGWTTETLPDAKLYLIQLDSLAQGNNYAASVKVQLPNEIVNGLESYTQYEVIYEIDGETKTEDSRRIWLKMVSDFEIELIAQVGQEILSNGDTVKEGEVVRYTTIVKNNTDQTFENLQLKAEVPEGTVVVEPVNGYVYSTNPFYYEEKAYMNEIDITIPTLVEGETYTTQYEVRVDMDAVTTVKEISNKAILVHNEKQIESQEMKNVLEESDIRLTMKRANDQSAQLLAGGTANYHICVENFSNKAIKNLEMQIISDVYNVINIKKYEGENIKNQEIYEENKTSISTIPANGNIIFEVYGKTINDVDDLSIYVKVGDSQENYRSNIVTEEFPNIEAEITLTSPQNNEAIKQGEEVTYNITVKNTGETIDGNILIEGTISEYLEIETIYINGKIDLQTTDETDKLTYIETILNHIIHYETVTMQSGETLQMTIVAKAKEIPISADGNIITNKFDLKVYSVLEDTSEEVKHTLDSGKKNVITGFAWLDSNANGRKDNDESTLSGITVKLYNTVNNSYLKDDNGNIITTQTGTNGEYGFTTIPNGSYIIIFDHGMENYEPTIYQANGTESSESSKAKLENIIVNGNTITVAGIELNNIEDEIIANANIGLKDKVVIPPDDGGAEDSEKPEVPGDGGTEEPEKPVEEKKEITGFAWLDLDRDGEKDDKEKSLEGIKVKIYDVSTKDYFKNNDGNIVQTKTDSEGKYKFTNIPKGSYIVIFEYDTEEYEPTTYLANGVDTTKNSKVVLKKININGEEKIIAVTDTINVQENISNINIGLKEKLIFDLEIQKYISRIVVQDSKETKSYDYENDTFAKVEIHRKRINGSLVVLEYTIKVKNGGEAAGYAKNIIDYLPSGLTFSSELNTDWYLSGNYLYTKSLENVELQPGEEKEIKLILTKTMTGENTGLINNRAEIYQDYNEYGIADIDSTPNNQSQEEDDLGSADVIILVSTGGGSVVAYITLLITNIILIGIAVKLMIKNKIIKISTKRGRR